MHVARPNFCGRPACSMKHTDRFREQQDALNRMSGLGPKTTNLHISSEKTAGQRSDLLREFVVHKRALMTNARCLTEGVDVPAIETSLLIRSQICRVGLDWIRRLARNRCGLKAS